MKEKEKEKWYVMHWDDKWRRNGYFQIIGSAIVAIMLIVTLVILIVF